jgi:hypothetical protein
VLYVDSTFGPGFNLSAPGIDELALDVGGREKITVGEFNGGALGLDGNQCNKSQPHTDNHQHETSFFHHGNLLFSCKKGALIYAFLTLESFQCL